MGEVNFFKVFLWVLAICVGVALMAGQIFFPIFPFSKKRTARTSENNGMYYCKWEESDVEGLHLDGIVFLYTEIGSDGIVRREIGLNEEGKVVHKCPSELYPNGTYGLFDNVEVAITDTRPLITKEEFEKLWK